MTTPASPFTTDGDLIVVEAIATGPAGPRRCHLVLDTGAAITTITPELAEALGYSPRDGIARTRVTSAIGSEEGYILRAAELTALGVTMTRFPVNVFDLGLAAQDGLLGMNFLSELDFEIRSSEQLVVVSGRSDVPRLRAAHAKVSRALDEALAAVKRERERADAQTERSALLLRKLEAARGSVSFRLGRATRAALDKRDPRQWVATFRGEDEILEELGDDPAPIEDAIDPGLPGATTSSALATLATLTPHGWRDTLERDPPSLVLIRGDALAAGSPWGDWGTPGGRDGLALVGELVTWCRARAIPVAYWDVDGTRPAPGLPFDLIV